MELKQKVLQSHVDENKISNSDANLSPENRKVINLELGETNKQLLIKRKKVSRRFGVYFMELFQALMEATKKNVAVCQLRRVKTDFQNERLEHLLVRRPKQRRSHKPYQNRFVKKNLLMSMFIV